MPRTYARETKHYDRAVLTHLVDTGEARYYPAQGGIWVIKTEDGTVAVRAHQVIDIPAPVKVEVEVEDVVEIPAPPPAHRTAWVSAQEQDDILSYFGI